MTPPPHRPLHGKTAIIAGGIDAIAARLEVCAANFVDAFTTIADTTPGTASILVNATDATTAPITVHSEKVNTQNITLSGGATW